MKEGNNVLCGEDIVEGIKGRLRGIYVYFIEINRGVELLVVKIFSGILQYGDFEYIGNGIVMRENIVLGEGKFYIKVLLNILVKNNFIIINVLIGFDFNFVK